MSVTITLPEDLEHRVIEDAARQGLPVEELVNRELRNLWPPQEPSESKLLTEINDGFPPSFWERYKTLRARLDEHTLVGPDHDDFLKMVDQVEQKQATRLEALAQLAKLRGVSLPAIIRSLGLEPV